MAWFLVGLGGATLVVLLVLLLMFLRHLKRISTSLQRLQLELIPILEEVRGEAEHARRRMVTIQERAGSLGERAR